MKLLALVVAVFVSTGIVTLYTALTVDTRFYDLFTHHIALRGKEADFELKAYFQADTLAKHHVAVYANLTTATLSTQSLQIGAQVVTDTISSVFQATCNAKVCHYPAGTCNTSTHGCDCDIHHVGPECTRCTICDTNPCKHEGRCVPVDCTRPDGYMCVCAGHWLNSTLCDTCNPNFVVTSRPDDPTRLRCDTCRPCTNNALYCSSHGQCAWSGSDCATPICIQCDPGFTGDRCDECIPFHYGVNCALCTCKNGICNDGADGDGFCDECYPTYNGTITQHWYGAKCDQPCTCVHGECDATPTGNGKCTVCDQGWAGANCDQPVLCEQGVPNLDINGDGKCSECYNGYSGPYCNRTATCQNGYAVLNASAANSGQCYECAKGWFGDNCDQVCCGGTQFCHQTTGQCYSDCPNPNFNPLKDCEDCLATRWGAQCEHSCSDTCSVNGICDSGVNGTGQCSRCLGLFFGAACDQNCSCLPENGHCNSGPSGDGFCQAGTTCKNGFYGSECDQPCLCLDADGFCLDNPTSNGTCNPLYACKDLNSYGPYCNQSCTCNVQGGICHNFPTSDGTCSTCRNGFTGPNCDQCLPNRYGANCERCLCDLLHGSCNDTITGDGHCQFCTDPHWYGTNCDQVCECVYGECNDGVNGNGLCTQCDSPSYLMPICGECDTANFAGTHCDQCVANHAGTNCTQCTCQLENSLIGACYDGVNGNGTCVGGCLPPFTGANCDQCVVNHYGTDCDVCLCVADNALQGCYDGMSGNGTCLGGCKTGSSGVYCDRCDSGYYGTPCRPCECLYGICNDGAEGNGQCSACSPGYYGVYCNLTATCRIQNTPDTALRGDGTCQQCLEGFQLPNCDVCSDGYVGDQCQIATFGCFYVGTDSVASMNFAFNAYYDFRAEEISDLCTICASNPCTVDPTLSPYSGIQTWISSGVLNPTPQIYCMPRIGNETPVIPANSQRTIETCYQYVAAVNQQLSQSFDAFGIRNQYECWFGKLSMFSTLTSGQLSQCNLACPGNAQETCGGTAQVEVFQLIRGL